VATYYELQKGSKDEDFGCLPKFICTGYIVGFSYHSSANCLVQCGQAGRLVNAGAVSNCHFFEIDLANIFTIALFRESKDNN